MHILLSILRTGLFSVAFTVSVYLGRLTVVPETQLSLVWPAAGVAVLWFMARTTWRVRVLDLAVFVAVTLILNTATGAPLSLAVCFAAANLLQVVVFLSLFRRLTPEMWLSGGDKPFAEVTQLWRLLIAAAVAAICGAIIGPTAMWILGGQWTALGTFVWVMRNVVSIVLISAIGFRVGYYFSSSNPHADNLLKRTTNKRWSQYGEATALILASAASYAVVFAFGHGLPLAFLLLCVTVWAGLRYGTTYVAIHDLALGTAAVLFTLAGWGPFAAIESDIARALTAQAFVGVITVIGLVLALMREERATLLQEVRRAERESAQQAQLLSTIIETMNEGLVVVNKNGEILHRNKAAYHLLGMRSANGRVADSNDYGLYYPDGRALSDADMPYRRALGGEEISNMDLVVKNKVVQGRTLNVSTSRLPANAGGGAIVVFHDVTADRRKRDELQSFAGVVAHD